MIKSKHPVTKAVPLVQAFKKFISSSQSGKRRSPAGSKLSIRLISNYQAVGKKIIQFEALKGDPILIPLMKGQSMSSLKGQALFWKKFHFEYTRFLYKNGAKDNYVGLHMCTIKTFLNWLKKDCFYPIACYEKVFKRVSDETPVIALSQERLAQMFNTQWLNSLDEDLLVTRDLFLFGCTVGLRYSDLRTLSKKNLTHVHSGTYLTQVSQKTHSTTRIKLPEYCLELIDKYQSVKKLLPYPPLYQFNLNLKRMGAKAGWTEPVGKSRLRNGKRIEVKTKTGGQYRFCDHLSSHMMRKTTITLLLTNGVPEHVVRKISGHAGHSKEFYRYVHYSQSFLDQHTINTFDQLPELLENG